MTREQAKELLPIINAFVEGKQIEYYDSSVNAWLSANSPTWRSEFTYRVKPEKKLVPFTYEDRNLFLGRIVRIKNTDTYGIVVNSTKCSVWVGSTLCGCRYQELFNDFEFEDGSHCGKLIEE